MAKKTFKPETIQNMADDLASLPPTQTAKDVGKIQTIRQLEPAIRTARENGYTWEQIIRRLNEQHGLDTTVTAVRNYLGPRYEGRGKSKAHDKINRQPIDPTSPALPATASRDAGVKPESRPSTTTARKRASDRGAFYSPARY